VNAASTVSDGPTAPPTALSRVGLALALMGSIIFVLAAVQPPAPSGPGLDQSWRIGLTMATLDHLRFGHDIVFTFGPLGYVLQGVPTPELARSTAYLSLGLAIIATWGIWTACAGRSRRMFRAAFAVAAIVIVAAMGIDYVAFLGTMALLARVSRSPRWEPYAAIAISLIGAFGLLSKLTLGLDVFGSAGVFWLSQIVQGPRRRRRSALISVGIATFVTAAPMLVLFGSISNAVEYGRSSFEIIGGYASAMWVPGPTSILAGAVAIFALIIIAAIALARERQGPLAAAVIAALFLAWKHGFVRADGHVIYFFVVAGALAPLLGIAARGRHALITAFLATVAGFGGLAYVVLTFGVDFPRALGPEKLLSDAAYLRDPVVSARRGQAATSAALAGDRLPPEALVAIGDGSVDVISSETALVSANGLRWQPLPIFQSYTAYTPRLDALDADALAARGPRFEFFRYEDIDLRYPFSVEPRTFAQLLCRYTPVAWAAVTPASGTFIALERAPQRTCAEAPISVADAPVALNAPLSVPALAGSSDVVLAWFQLRPTLLGTIRSALWRPPRVMLRVSYGTGETRTWRLVPDTANDGLILSPIPRNADDARHLFARDPVPDATVASVEILAPARFYRLDAVRFTRLHR
jgi:hypothetical protein